MLCMIWSLPTAPVSIHTILLLLGGEESSTHAFKAQSPKVTISQQFYFRIICWQDSHYNWWNYVGENKTKREYVLALALTQQLLHEPHTHTYTQTQLLAIPLPSLSAPAMPLPSIGTWGTARIQTPLVQILRQCIFYHFTLSHKKFSPCECGQYNDKS